MTIEEKLLWFELESNLDRDVCNTEAFRECLAMLKKCIEQMNAMTNTYELQDLYDAELLKAAEGT